MSSHMLELPPSKRSQHFPDDATQDQTHPTVVKQEPGEKCSHYQRPTPKIQSDSDVCDRANANMEVLASQVKSEIEVVTQDQTFQTVVKQEPEDFIDTKLPQCQLQRLVPKIQTDVCDTDRVDVKLEDLESQVKLEIDVAEELPEAWLPETPKFEPVFIKTKRTLTERLKANPEAFQAYRRTENMRRRDYYARRSEEVQARERELGYIRQRRYRERLKQKKALCGDNSTTNQKGRSSPPCLTPADWARKRNKETKRRRYQEMSAEDRAAENKQRREAYRAKKIKEKEKLMQCREANRIRQRRFREKQKQNQAMQELEEGVSG